MIDAEYISEALGGKRIPRNEYQMPCPVTKHRSGMLVVGDRLPSGVWVFCRAGCEFLEIVSALESRGLWPKKVHTHDEKMLFAKRKSNQGFQLAMIWIACYESSRTRTEQDQTKYLKLKEQYKYQCWANKVIAEAVEKIQRGYVLSPKQIAVIEKASNILN